MKILRILLALTLVAVAALYGYTTVSSQLQGTDIGPQLSCDSDTLDISVSDDKSVLLQGVTARDKQDGDLTADILISGISKMVDNCARVTYLVFDSDHNMATLERTVRYTDYVAPRFQILEPLIYTVSDSVVLLDRLLVEDVLDGDITGSVRVSYLTETELESVYTADLQVTNSAGDTARVTLPIIRQESRIQAQVVLDEYLVYADIGSDFNPRSYLSKVIVGSGSSETRGDSSDVIISGKADTSKAGTYYIYYTYQTDTVTAQSILTVVVE